MVLLRGKVHRGRLKIHKLEISIFLGGVFFPAAAHESER